MYIKPEEWISRAQQLSIMGLQLGKFLVRKNYRGRGEADADELMENIMIAMVAMYWASAHADEVLIPLDREAKCRLFWCQNCKYTESLSRDEFYHCPNCGKIMEPITQEVI